jgi:ATP-dependent Clp protease ATP-binding subunit ClpA
MFERFTPNARRIVLVATEEARGLGHGELGPEHLLLGALRSGGASEFSLTELGLREGAVRSRIGMKLPRDDAAGRADVTLCAGAVWALAAAVRLADDADELQVGSGHILRALIDAAGAREVLADCRISGDAVRAALRRQPADSNEQFAAAIAAVDGGDPIAAARALIAIVLRRGPVAAWLAERGVDESAVRRAFSALELERAAQTAPARAGAGASSGRR